MIIIGIVVFLAYSLYNEAFYKTIYYVFACPQDRSTSICYKVKADYVPKDCNDERGCPDDYFTAINFNNGG